jgi:hypothetical protein
MSHRAVDHSPLYAHMLGDPFHYRKTSIISSIVFNLRSVYLCSIHDYLLYMINLSVDVFTVD